MGIGEVVHHLPAKYFMKVEGKDSSQTCGTYQLCGVLVEGIKGVSIPCYWCGCNNYLNISGDLYLLVGKIISMRTTLHTLFGKYGTSVYQLPNLFLTGAVIIHSLSYRWLMALMRSSLSKRVLPRGIIYIWWNMYW